MNNTLTDLNNYLFEQLERLNDDEPDDEGLDLEIRKTEAVVKVSEKIIENGELAFKTMKHLDDYGYHPDKGTASLPPMLSTGGLVRNEQTLSEGAA